MKGTTEFRRKEAQMFLDKFRVVAVETLGHEEYDYFSKHLLDDYAFIEDHAEEMHVDSDGYANSLLVLNDRDDDGILVNSEGSYYARYSSFLPYAKPMFKKQIKDIVDEIIEGKFGDFDKGAWLIGFDDIKEHFDVTVTPNNGIGTLIIEELESRDEISEVIAAEDAIEITGYLNHVPENTSRGERIVTLFSLMGCNLEDVHILDDDEEHDLATIVELNNNTLTEQGQKDWSDVLSAKVVRIYEGSYGVQIAVTGCDPQRIEDFSKMLAGYCTEADYKRWVVGNGEDETPIDSDNKYLLNNHDIEMKCAKHLLWLYDEEGGVQGDFRNCHIRNANFSNTDLTSALFDDCVIENCNFSSAALNTVEMSRAVVVNSNFSYTVMDDIVCRESDFRLCNFSQNITYHGNFSHSKFDKCDLFNANFHNSCFDGATFNKTNTEDAYIDLEDVPSEEEWSNTNSQLIM